MPEQMDPGSQRAKNLILLFITSLTNEIICFFTIISSLCKGCS